MVSLFQIFIPHLMSSQRSSDRVLVNPIGTIYKLSCCVFQFISPDIDYCSSVSIGIFLDSSIPNLVDIISHLGLAAAGLHCSYYSSYIRFPAIVIWTTLWQRVIPIIKNNSCRVGLCLDTRRSPILHRSFDVKLHRQGTSSGLS